MTDKKLCPKCRGERGWMSYNENMGLDFGTWDPCWKCEGTGYVTEKHIEFREMNKQSTEPHCCACGYRHSTDDPCLR
jgi:DnaJ-class molecular chaperone